MKVNMNTQRGLCTWGLCFLALWPAVGRAHPEPDSGGRGIIPPDPLSSRARQQTPTAPARNPVPPEVSPNQPRTVNPEGVPQVRKLWIWEQRTKGYASNVLASRGQASHQHVDDVLGTYKTRFPLEIWYFASVKRPEAGGQAFYCVAPRVENPSSTQWTTRFLVSLTRVENKQSIPVVSKQVDVVYPGGSSEVFSHCEQVATRPVWVIETPHGKAIVNWPKK